MNEESALSDSPNGNTRSLNPSLLAGVGPHKKGPDLLVKVFRGLLIRGEQDPPGKSHGAVRWFGAGCSPSGAHKAGRLVVGPNVPTEADGPSELAHILR